MTEEEYREQMIAALKFIGGGEISGPSGLEGIAMALAGEGLKSPVAGGLYAIAAALDRIADALEAKS